MKYKYFFQEKKEAKALGSNCCSKMKPLASRISSQAECIGNTYCVGALHNQKITCMLFEDCSFDREKNYHT